ncbi:DNA helicase PcrA [Occultella gossypii]|uniref:ATP-dependent DNA helicase n=1 Tax=Occultella gossypii TaxID=2800820 RepID=A0ABS7SBJ9_9MICO|nr:DNA helicase PcrA [Occultella gossypii]MBZ2197715.1 DNA helicase PcrA [Occultella gossypii]
MTSLFDNLPLPGLSASADAHLPRVMPPRDPDAQASPDGRDSNGENGPGSLAAEALLDGLNPQQRAAVVHEGGQLLIIAGAGSGKTRVLTHRIAYLLATGRARTGEILAITFTNKAAAEMRERVSELVGPRARNMWVSTFHSACVRILRREAKTLGLRSNFSIYDAADSQRLMLLVCRELDLDPKRFPPKAFSNRVSDLKNELVDPDDYAKTVGDSNPFEQNLAAAYRLYNERLRQAHALDFDDLIMTTVNLLQAFPAVAEHYRRRFRHILVDEYQDTNQAQYMLVRELAGVPLDPSAAAGSTDENDNELPTAELTVVGDADQSIYAFRGATIRNIVEFESDYPDATTILLEQNYRSTQTILSAANAVISRNPDRRAKNLWTDSGSGPQIVGYVADSEHEEARFIAEEIDRLGDSDGVRPGDVAIFYRTNAQSRALEEVLIRVGLPYKVVGGTRFYERREVKDAIAYLRAIANPDDAINLRRILNVPKRGVGDRAEAMITAHSERERISFGAAIADAENVIGLATRSLTAVRGFATLMTGLRDLAAGGASPAEVLDAALDRSGYLAELRASDDPQDASRVENLAELHAVATEFSESDPEGDLGDFLERVALVADTDQIPDDDDDRGVVTLMTVHTAKGLEFPVVFVTGLEDGTFPHQRSLADETELAEERRLAYVALTRARQRLYLSRAAVRTAWGMPNELPASRFIADIPEELMDWKRRESSMAALRGGSFTGGYRNHGDGGRSGSRGPSAPPVRTTRAGADAPSFGSAKPRADAPSVDVGDRVTHDAYGMGRVIAVESTGANAVAKIDFGSSGTKRLLLRYSPVTKL